MSAFRILPWKEEGACEPCEDYQKPYVILAKPVDDAALAAKPVQTIADFNHTREVILARYDVLWEDKGPSTAWFPMYSAAVLYATPEDKKALDEVLPLVDMALKFFAYLHCKVPMPVEWFSNREEYRFEL